MIGGTILVLPLLGLVAGYINSGLVCCFVGLVAWYTGYLIVLHFG